VTTITQPTRAAVSLEQTPGHRYNLDTMAKMHVFISWSGKRSRAVAEALKKYLPMIVNDLEPWLSTKDIDKGSRSTEEIATALVDARAGIICLTPNNLKEPWILFEAGAIAKTVREKPLACTLLIGLEIPDVSGPLAQFQATKPTKPDLLQMVMALNKALGQSALDSNQLAEAFDLFWPKLHAVFENLPSDGPDAPPERMPNDMLKELIESTRSISANIVQLSSQMTEQFTRIVVPRGILNAGSLGDNAYGARSFGREVSETLAAPEHMRHVNQLDELPSPKPGGFMGTLRAAAAQRKPKGDDPAGKK
jgi:hypothetical protein